MTNTTEFMARKSRHVQDLAEAYGAKQSDMEADIHILASVMIAVAEDHLGCDDEFCVTCSSLKLVLPELAARYRALAG